MNLQRETLLCQYRYDGLDRLVGNELPDRPTLQRFYCKSRLATEIQGATQYSIIQHDDLLLAQRQRQGDGSDTTLLATDLQRSVLQTNKANNGRRPIAYSPYGHRPAESGLSSLLAFNGERPDPVTGHYLLGNGYRAFNPVLMRFNSPDSWSPFGKGGLNSYAYCKGDPINLIDHTGHAPLSAILKLKSVVEDLISINFARKLGSTQSAKTDVDQIYQSARSSGKLENAYTSKTGEHIGRPIDTPDSSTLPRYFLQPKSLKTLSIKSLIKSDVYKRQVPDLPAPLQRDVERIKSPVVKKWPTVDASVARLRSRLSFDGGRIGPNMPDGFVEELRQNDMFIRFSQRSSEIT